jgi:hypothetical protein
MQLTIKVNSAGISRPVTNQSSVRYSGDLKRPGVNLTPQKTTITDLHPQPLLRMRQVLISFG